MAGAGDGERAWKFMYFKGVRGLLEMTRMMCYLKGFKYTIDEVDLARWPELKPRMYVNISV
mgnify:CR=1 FL=1